MGDIYMRDKSISPSAYIEKDGVSEPWKVAKVSAIFVAVKIGISVVLSSNNK